MKLGAGLVLAIAVAALLAGASLAKGPRVPSEITLENETPGVYTGSVKSREPACKKRRLVAVWHDENDNGLDSSDYHIGSARTSKKGRYEVRGNQAPIGDTIIAQVTTKKLRDGTRCKGDEVDEAALSR